VNARALPSQRQRREKSLDRRQVIAGIAAVAAAGDARAAPKVARYGAAAMRENFIADARYREALVKHCDVIVPMNDLKWEALRPNRDTFAFKEADEILDFARANGKAVRGHTLCWYGGMPAWAKALNDRRDAERELIRHIETVVGRYAGRMPSWDVVNEAIAHDPEKQGVWRDTVWQKLLGPAHVEIAFRTAAKADPKAELVYNEYDLETTDPREERRRQETLNLVRRLQDKKIPIHAIGFQAHLYLERSIDADGIGRFVRELRKLGVKPVVTELDVIDWKIQHLAPERDRIAAAHVDRFLGALASEGQIDTLITWGITDRYSWVNEVFKRPDGLAPRPLPLDDTYRPKPLMAVIERYRRGT
jgi:endo-1,4-beta-xylanase